MSKSTEPVQAFFAAFGKGDMDGIMATLHDDVQVVAGGKEVTPIYGTYSGHSGAKQFLTNLGENFDTQAFSVDELVGEGDTAFASGSFAHKVKSTGKLFESDWVLLAKIEEGKISRYHFFEDTAGAVAAFQP